MTYTFIIILMANLHIIDIYTITVIFTFTTVVIVTTIRKVFTCAFYFD